MYKFISAAPKCLIFGLMMVFLAVGICGCGINYGINKNGLIILIKPSL
jgi:multisubunit Na+/H+ antiporter MnhG subunit